MDLCMVNNQSDIFMYRIDKRNTLDTSQNYSIGEKISKAFGQIKVLWISKIDASPVLEHPKLSEISKKLWLAFYSKFLILNCKDGCRIMILASASYQNELDTFSPKSRTIDFILLDGITIHNMKFIPVLP